MTQPPSQDTYAKSSVQAGEIRLEQLRGLYAIGNYPLLATLLISLLLAFALHGSATSAHLIFWLVTITFALVISTIVLGKVDKDSINAGNARSLKILHMYILIQNGLIFGMSGYLLFDPQSAYNQTVLLLLICGMGAGAVGVYSLSIEAYLYFSTPLIAPLIIAVALSDSQLRPVMLPALMVYYLAMLVSAARTNKVAIRSIVLGVENSRLNQELIRQMERLRNTESILEASERRHRTLLEQAEDGIVLLDSDGCVLSANDQMYEIAGLKSGPMGGMKFSSLFSDSHKGTTADFLSRVSKEQTVAENRKILRHDNTESDVSIRAREIEHGIIQCIVHDISDKKRTKESLRLLDMAIRTSRLGVTFRDCENIICYINPAEAAMHGFSPEELMGRDISMLTGARPCRKHTIDELMEMRSWARESTNIKKDGAEFPVYLASDVVLDDNGEPLGVITISEDLTEKKRTELELREAHEMLRQLTNELQQTNADLGKALAAAEAANESKSQFLANMSHEIRTPMNAIIGLNEILMSTPLDSEQKDYVQTISTSADSLLSIINDILDISKIEAGKLVLHQMEFSPQSVVIDAVRLLSMHAMQKGLDFLESIADDVPESVVGDPIRIRQILVNLLGNAIKFTDTGSIWLKVERCDSAPGEICLIFKVIDTGIGIAEDQISQMFESYTQADSSNTRRYGGTGLGLFITRKLVESMGGTLHAQSQLGQGSTFSFDVRLDSPAPVARIRQTPSPDKDDCLIGLKTLLVEDNLINQKITYKLLTRMGIEAEVEKTGEGAIARLTREDFKLVLMDVKMPGMDGYETTRIIREMQRQGNIKQIPVLALTAHAFEDSRQKCISAGMDGFISKPVRFNELCAAIKAAISQPSKIAHPDAAKT